MALDAGLIQMDVLQSTVQPAVAVEDRFVGSRFYPQELSLGPGSNRKLRGPDRACGDGGKPRSPDCGACGSISSPENRHLQHIGNRLQQQVALPDDPHLCHQSPNRKDCSPPWVSLV